MDSIISLTLDCTLTGALGTSLFKTSEFLCFLLGLAPRAMSKAEVAFSAHEALRKAQRACLLSLKANSASFFCSSAVSR